MINIAKFLIYATGYFFVIYGGLFTLMPHELATLITGATPQANSATIDFRATYGGLQVAVGCILLLIMKLRKDIDLALFIVAITLLFMAVGRAFGILIDGQANLMMFIFLVAEIVCGLAALIFRKHLLFENSELNKAKA